LWEKETEFVGAVELPQIHLYPGLRHSISEAEVSDLRAWLQAR
jgi:hypothetical protein